MYATEIWVNLHWLVWYRDWWCCLSGLRRRVDRMNLKSVGRLLQFIASPDVLIACSSSVWSCCCTRMMPSLCPFYVLNCIILCATSRITSQILKPKRWQVWPRANRVYCGALDAKEAPKKNQWATNASRQSIIQSSLKHRHPSLVNVTSQLW